MVCALLCSGCFTYVVEAKRPTPSGLGVVAALEAGAATGVGVIAHSRDDEEDGSLAVAILGGFVLMAALDVTTVLVLSYLKNNQ